MLFGSTVRLCGVRLIKSGTHTPGIAAADFCLPAGTALRYERPAEALRPYFLSYAVLESDPAVFTDPGSWMLPGWAQIWIFLAEPPVGVKIGRLQYGPLGSVSLFGVTSQAMPVTASGGVTIVVDVSPLGWARLFARSAALVRDKLVPLDELLPVGWASDLLATIAPSDRDLSVKNLLDAFLLDRLPPAHVDEGLITMISRSLVDESTRELGRVAVEIGVTPQALLRQTKRYFGFPPKLLAVRARFIRAITAMLLQDGSDVALTPPGYHDASHFIRDGLRFLGMTPRRFLAMELPYLRAALRARALVLDAPTPSLDRPAMGGASSSPRRSLLE